jgi:hypothetical protein
VVPLVLESMEPTVDQIADGFAQIFRNPITPTVMIMVNPPGLEPGTWLLVRDQKPRRLGEAADFDRIWQDALGIGTGRNRRTGGPRMSDINRAVDKVDKK